MGFFGDPQSPSRSGIPGIGDLGSPKIPNEKSGDFYPWNFWEWGFFGDGDIPPKSHLWPRVQEKLNFNPPYELKIQVERIHKY